MVYCNYSLNYQKMESGNMGAQPTGVNEHYMIKPSMFEPMYAIFFIRLVIR